VDNIIDIASLNGVAICIFIVPFPLLASLNGVAKCIFLVPFPLLAF
jgi:hypothetical protein